jgi:hypothetical protein
MKTTHRICSRTGCNDLGINKANGLGSTWYCDKHHQFLRMRTNARYVGKKVPSWEECETMLQPCLNEHGELGKCPSCGQQMQWKTGADRKRGPVLSLQHNLAGTMCFICLSCNVGHGGSRAGDRYLEKTPVGFKYCGDCDTVRPLEQFRRDRRTGTGFGALCRDCSNKRREKHRESKKQEVAV